jgi:DNA-binding MarR family transcriptional regulator
MVISGMIDDMSRKGTEHSNPAFRTLTAGQQRAWLAYMRVQLRLTYEMNRQLQADSNLSLPDYDVLNALRYSPGGRMRISGLAAQIGWERSRLSHHVRRLEKRELVDSRLAPADRRATEITLTDRGWDEITRASSGHIDLLRRLFFDGLPDELLEPFTVGLESVYDNIIDRGTLPAPADSVSQRQPA